MHPRRQRRGDRPAQLAPPAHTSRQLGPQSKHQRRPPTLRRPSRPQYTPPAPFTAKPAACRAPALRSSTRHTAQPVTHTAQGEAHRGGQPAAACPPTGGRRCSQPAALAMPPPRPACVQRSLGHRGASKGRPRDSTMRGTTCATHDHAPHTNTQHTRNHSTLQTSCRHRELSQTELHQPGALHSHQGRRNTRRAKGESPWAEQFSGRLQNGGSSCAAAPNTITSC